MLIINVGFNRCFIEVFPDFPVFLNQCLKPVCTKGETLYAVTDARILRRTRFGQRGTETCVARQLARLQFTPGLTQTKAQVGYRWNFDLGGPTNIRFAAASSEADKI